MLLTLAFAALAGRPSFEPVSEQYGVPATQLCFPSGLRVVVASDRAFPVASVVTVLDGGSAIGPEAHLAEHLWFRSRPGGGPEVEARLDALGASHNAHTSLDHRTYVVTAPPTALAELGRLTGSLLLDPLVGVEPAVVEVERQLVRRESERDRKPTAELAEAEIARQLFPAPHPYAKLASPPVAAADLDGLRAWSAAHGGPRQATVYVAGDFELDAGVQAFLGAMPDAALVDPKNPKAPLNSGVCAERPAPTATLPVRAAREGLPQVSAPVRGPLVVVGWALPGGWREDDALSLLAVQLYELILEDYVLEHGGGARLLEQGRASDVVGCGVTPGREASLAICYLTVSSTRSPEHLASLAFAALDDVTAKSLLANTGLTEWLRWSYTDLRAALHADLEDLGDADGGRALGSAVHLHHTGSPTWLGDRTRQMNAISDGALVETLRAVFRHDATAAFVLVPEAPEPASATAVATVTAPPPLPARADAATLAAIASEPTTHRTATLPNGLQVLVLPLGHAPRVHAVLALPGGRWRAPPGVAELHGAASDWWYDLPEGSSYDRPREFYGEWEARGDPGGDVIGLSGLSGNLEAALWSLRDAVDHARVDRTTFTVGSKWLRGWLVERPPRVAAEQSSWAGIWPAVAPLVREDADAHDALGLQDLATWHDQIVNPAGALLLIAGRVDADRALALAEAHFGSWKPTGATRPALPPPPALPERRVDTLTDPVAMSAQVRARCVVPGADAAAVRVASEALGERLWQAARAGSALTYDPQVQAWTGPGGVSGLAFDATVAPADVDRILAQWDGALLGLANETPADEVARARRAAATTLRSTWTSVDRAIAATTDAWFTGMPMPSLFQTSAALAKVDGAQVAAVAKACHQGEHVVVLRP